MVMAVTETSGNRSPRMELELAVVDAALEGALEVEEVLVEADVIWLVFDVVDDVVVTGMPVEDFTVLSEVVDVVELALVLVDVAMELVVALEVVVLIVEDVEVVVTWATWSLNVPELPLLSSSPE
jgi:hypothetical protein